MRLTFCKTRGKTCKTWKSLDWQTPTKMEKLYGITNIYGMTKVFGFENLYVMTFLDVDSMCMYVSVCFSPFCVTSNYACILATPAQFLCLVKLNNLLGIEMCVILQTSMYVMTNLYGWPKK